ncbi:umecyanin-like [Syzygium oleosum]|uniref:umecyanin-like n=1 Tax=Syzygium oleosum TaxID=219896 RepID=UPI0024B8B2C6|nr:umecyanin-like [Syzygium oleosum]
MAKMCVAIAAVLAVAALLQTSATGTEYIVGGEQGWKVPPEDGTPYKTWAEDKSFKVGDVLVFDFSKEEQDVTRVRDEAAFESCDSTDHIFQKTTGPVRWELKGAGEYYFIGTVGKRCLRGQKLAINVADAPGGPSPSVEDLIEKPKQGTPIHSWRKTPKETTSQTKRCGPRLRGIKLCP